MKSATTARALREDFDRRFNEQNLPQPLGDIIDHPWTRGRIRWAAHDLAQSEYFEPADSPDIQQELRLDLFRRLPRWDPSKALLRTYIDRVLRHCQATMIEKRKAQKRLACSPHLRVSLESPDREGREEIHQVNEELCDDRLRREELAFDFRQVEETLDADEHELVRLIATRSVTAVAKSLGVSRGTVYSRLRKTRSKFKELGGYLGRE